MRTSKQTGKNDFVLICDCRQNVPRHNETLRCQANFWERRLNLWIFTALSGQQQLSFNILLLRLHPWRHVPYIILLNSLEIQVHHQKCWAMLSYCLLSLFVASENWKIGNFISNKSITLLFRYMDISTSNKICSVIILNIFWK